MDAFCFTCWIMSKVNSWVIHLLKYSALTPRTLTTRRCERLTLSSTNDTSTKAFQLLDTNYICVADAVNHNLCIFTFCHFTNVSHSLNEGTLSWHTQTLPHAQLSKHELAELMVIMSVASAMTTFCFLSPLSSHGGYSGVFFHLRKPLIWKLHVEEIALVTFLLLYWLLTILIYRMQLFWLNFSYPCLSLTVAPLWENSSIAAHLWTTTCLSRHWHVLQSNWLSFHRRQITPCRFTDSCSQLP